MLIGHPFTVLRLYSSEKDFIYDKNSGYCDIEINEIFSKWYVGIKTIYFKQKFPRQSLFLNLDVYLDYF